MLLAHHEVVAPVLTVLLGGAGVSLGVLRALLLRGVRRAAGRDTGADAVDGGP